MSRLVEASVLELEIFNKTITLPSKPQTPDVHRRPPIPSQIPRNPAMPRRSAPPRR